MAASNSYPEPILESRGMGDFFTKKGNVKKAKTFENLGKNIYLKIF